MKGEITTSQLILLVLFVLTLAVVLIVTVVPFGKLPDVAPAGCSLGEVKEPCPCNGQVVKPSADPTKPVYCCDEGVSSAPC
jgi:hypothetical protein